MTLGDVISAYRKEHRLSMDQFAKISGISKGYISMLERNRTQRGEQPSPSYEMFRSAARAMQLDVDELIRKLEGKALDETLPHNPPLPSGLSPIEKGSYVPLYHPFVSKIPTPAAENLERKAWMPDGISADFSLVCQDDSMINARIFPGDIVYFRKQNTVEDGDIAAVLLKGQEILLRRVYFSSQPENRLILHAENLTYVDQHYFGKEIERIRILGKAIHFLSKVK